MALVQLVQKVLSVVARILAGLCGVVGVVCLVYTLASSAVQEGFDALGDALGATVQEALGGLVDDWQQRLAEAAGGSAGTGSGEGGGILSTLAGAVGLGSGGDTSAESFADPVLGAAYQTWKDAVGSPVERIFAGTGIDAMTIAAVAGGSSSATDLLAQLDENALVTISGNATNLAATARSVSVPSTLPADVQEQLRQADEHCAAFCDDVLQLVDDVRTLKGGNILAGSAVTSSAYAAYDELQAMEANMQQAEAWLA